MCAEGRIMLFGHNAQHKSRSKVSNTSEIWFGCLVLNNDVTDAYEYYKNINKRKSILLFLSDYVLNLVLLHAL